MSSVIHSNPPRWARIRRLVLIRDQHQCQIRGPYCTQGATTVDHIQPRVHGGTDDFSNLQAACSICNRDKGSGLHSLNRKVVLDASQAEIPPLLSLSGDYSAEEDR